MIATLRATLTLVLLASLAAPGCGGGDVVSPTLGEGASEDGSGLMPSLGPAESANVKRKKTPALAEPIDMRPIDD